MTRFMTILASLTLATALIPIAASATTMSPLSYVQSAAHKAMSGPLPEVQKIAVNADAATAPGLTRQNFVQNGQVIVQSGPADQKYPDAFGG